MSSNFVMPKQIISGAGALEGAEAKEAFKNAGSKALIVSGKVMEKVGNVAKVTAVLDDLGIRYAIYTEITGEPTDTMIDGGLEVYKKEGCDFLIGFGGGSPLDSMKAIAALVTNPGKIPDYMGKVITRPVPPMIAIPTTAGTGSEATWFTIITDSQKDIKMLLKGPVLMPDVAIVDYRFTLTSPKSVTAAPGLDALTHAIEGYTSRKAQPMTDTFAVSAVKRIFKYLPVAYADGSNEEAREQMSLAALEAGIVINNSSVTIVHGMSRPIGALFHVPHGMSNAMLLKACFTFALDGAYGKFADLGRAIEVADGSDSDEAAAEKFLDAVIDICKVCEIPTLEEYGIDKEKFFAFIDKMADDALASGSPGNTMKEVSKDDIVAIYKALW
ncbi:MAG: iron-containing alcohol dehydrogenase [Lachnospiraceae bacterium]|nr:iron-containing alcohol dehydrogenase [Lachnospiraceae bacterium]